ncbi:MAG: BrnT family toxin [Planctomycetes bacterium]|nr:BrnT family toxin [Planctomycetota bacterium]
MLVGDEADAAGVVLVAGIVQALGPWEERHGAPRPETVRIRSNSGGIVPATPRRGQLFPGGSRQASVTSRKRYRIARLGAPRRRNKRRKEPTPGRATDRWLALGRTDAGRALLVVFTLRGPQVRVISARPMSRRERRLYDQTKRA